MKTKLKQPTVPSAACQLTRSAKCWTVAGRINGKTKTFSVQPGNGSLKGPPQPPTMRWYRVLRKQTQTGTPVSQGTEGSTSLMETQLLRRSRWAFEETSAFFSLPIPLQQCWRKWWQPNISSSLGAKPTTPKMWFPFSFGSSLLWGRILVAFVTLLVVLSYGSMTSVASHPA